MNIKNKIIIEKQNIIRYYSNVYLNNNKLLMRYKLPNM